MSMQDIISKCLSWVTELPEPLGYDVETNGLDWRKCYVCGYSFSDGREAYYIPVRHKAGANIVRVDEFEAELNAVLKQRARLGYPIVGHNIKFDMHMSANHGVMLDDLHCYDTSIREALINEHLYQYSLGACAARYTEVEAKKEAELYAHISRMFGGPATRKAMDKFYLLPGNDKLAVEYAAGDTLTTVQLFKAQQPILEAQDLLQIADIETKVTPVLYRMERLGFAIDVEAITPLTLKLELMLDELMEGMSDINVRSKDDLVEYFTFHDITDWPITDKGNPSFRADWLCTSEEGQKITHIRKLTHLNTNFLIPLQERYIHNGFVNPTFNQLKSDAYGTKTGRLSCSDPNGQQAPKRDKQIGPLFRSLWVPSIKGRVIEEKDWSQCQPRIFAHYSREERLLRGYNSTPVIDMHQIASDMLAVERDAAKQLNLGIIFCLGKAKLAKALGIELSAAKALLDRYYNLFPETRPYRDRHTGHVPFRVKAEEIARSRGYIRTLLGRRIRFPDPRFAYRAINSYCQGGEADVAKLKLVEIDDYIRSLPDPTVCQMRLQVHDAVVFEKEADFATGEIDKIMCDVQRPPYNLRVPFAVDTHVGLDWAKCTYSQKVAA